MRIGVVIACAALLSSTLPAYASSVENTCETISSRMAFLDKNASFVVKVYPQNSLALGSGIVFKDNDGWGIITNNHVIADSSFAAYVVFLGSNRSVKATIIGRDPSLDIALLSIPDRVPPSVSPIDLSKYPRGVHVGDEVYAVGYAHGRWMPSIGWVNSPMSAFSPIFSASQAPLQPGNSGGPLVYFTEKCAVEVVGINTIMITQGLSSLSVPLKYVKKMLPRLRTEKIVEHAYLGVAMVDVETIPPPLFEQITQKPYEGESGVFVLKVGSQTSAEKVGMKAGDIITGLKYQGNAVPFENADDLFMRIFFDFKPGDEIEFVTKRGAQSFARTIVLDGTVAPPLSDSD